MKFLLALLDMLMLPLNKELQLDLGTILFKPNQPVKRGEMAAFLDRTNDGLLEQSGAITVQGTITGISFNEKSVTDDETVTKDVYGSNNGSITI